MSCQIDPSIIERTIAFHGHSCPGLAIGIRAAEIALRELPDVDQASLVCVTETDMCGVDAIQFLTGCTYGKGNLIHRDYGKLAFSFHDRRSGRGFRLVFRREIWAAGLLYLADGHGISRGFHGLHQAFLVTGEIPGRPDDRGGKV